MAELRAECYSAGCYARELTTNHRPLSTVHCPLALRFAGAEAAGELDGLLGGVADAFGEGV
jgi:hypothetical protein